MVPKSAASVEVSADVVKQRVTLRFIGFIQAEHAGEGRRLYLEAIDQLRGKPYTALTYLHELRIMTPEAFEIIASMVDDAGKHQCVRSARVVGEKQWTVKMQFQRIDSRLNNYDTEFFTSEREAIQYLDEYARSALDAMSMSGAHRRVRATTAAVI
jgi:hypothetical protein